MKIRNILVHRCDGFEDCGNQGADEIDCKIVRTPPFYNSHLIPSPDSQNPVRVNISIMVKDFFNVDESNNKIRVNYRYNLTWRDSRLKFENLRDDMRQNLLKTSEVEKIWRPSIFIFEMDLFFQDNFAEPTYLVRKDAEVFETAPASDLNNAKLYSWEHGTLFKRETKRLEKYFEPGY